MWLIEEEGKARKLTRKIFSVKKFLKTYTHIKDVTINQISKGGTYYETKEHAVA